MLPNLPIGTATLSDSSMTHRTDLMSLAMSMTLRRHLQSKTVQVFKYQIQSWTSYVLMKVQLSPSTLQTPTITLQHTKLTLRAAIAQRTLSQQARHMVSHSTATRTTTTTTPFLKRYCQKIVNHSYIHWFRYLTMNGERFSHTTLSLTAKNPNTHQ